MAANNPDLAKELICDRCAVALQKGKTHFRYLGHAFHTETLRCPVCGLIFLDEQLVKGRMAQVEMELEDK